MNFSLTPSATPEHFYPPSFRQDFAVEGDPADASSMELTDEQYYHYAKIGLYLAQDALDAAEVQRPFDMFDYQQAKLRVEAAARTLTNIRDDERCVRLGSNALAALYESGADFITPGTSVAVHYPAGETVAPYGTSTE